MIKLSFLSWLDTMLQFTSQLCTSMFQLFKNTEQGLKPSKMYMCEVLQTCQSLISGADFENTPAVQLYTVQTSRM